jgi:PAS domain S-box-containing protein
MTIPMKLSAGQRTAAGLSTVLILLVATTAAASLSGNGMLGVVDPTAAGLVGLVSVLAGIAVISSATPFRRDIEARNRAEAALRSSEERFRALVEHSFEAVALLDRSGKTFYVSPAAQRVFGRGPEAIVGRNAFDRLHPDDFTHCVQLFGELVQEPSGTKNTLLRYRHEDGSWRSIEVTAQKATGMAHTREETGTAAGTTRIYLATKAPYRDAKGNVVGVIGISRDVTERKEMEEALRNLNATLEQRVRERTAQLEDANKELEAFSYSVSHDLRAPLRTLDGFAELLERHAEQLPEEGRFCLQNLRETGRQMGRLIDDLLELARMSLEPLKTRLVEPGELARAVLGELQGELAGRHVEVTIGELPGCHADPTLLKQVFLNLLSNALKYTRKREVARIEIGTVMGHGSWVMSGNESVMGHGSWVMGGEETHDSSRMTHDGLMTHDGITRMPHDSRLMTVFFIKDNGAGFDMQQADRLFGVFRACIAPTSLKGPE